MDAKHTPGPYRLSTLCHIAVATTARTTEWTHGSGRISTHPLPIAECSLEQIPASERKANARRIAALLNACDGLSTEALERVAEIHDPQYRLVQLANELDAAAVLESRP